NLSLILNKIKTTEKALINVGKFVLLEVLFASIYLKGDYFTVPFSTYPLRKSFKYLFSYDILEITEQQIDDLINMSDNIQVLENFYDSIKFLEPEEKEIFKNILDLKLIFPIKSLLYDEIKNNILIKKNYENIPVRIYASNPIDFFLNDYYHNLDYKSFTKHLIDIYVHLHGYDLFTKIFEKEKQFYYEEFNEIVDLNDKIIFEYTREKKESTMIKFLNKIPKSNLRWSIEELNELYFIKNLTNTLSTNYNLYELYKNFCFSFIYKRTFNSFKTKFYKITNFEFIPPLKLVNIKSRFNYIEKQTQKRLSKQFRKEYLFLLHQDALKLKFIY
ncbi:hypothetical protein TUBRATIS_20180, partial [Tubulinosema ratisbonensis]